MKTCSRCEDTKPLTEFYRHKRYADGHQSYCKECHSDYYKSYYKGKEGVYKERSAKHFQDNKEAHYSRKNARRQIEAEQLATLSPEERAGIEDLYWLARDLRAVTGEPYEVDHIKPLSKGGRHELSNLQVLPRDMNRSKGAKYGNQTA